MKTLKELIQEFDGVAFPSNSYVKMVLEPAYNEAKRHFVDHMLHIDYAHLIMLVEENLMKKEDAVKIVRALGTIKKDVIQSSFYNPKFEDLFFQLEHELLAKAGDAGGNLHIARSRNDMGIAIYRMTLKEKIVRLIEQAVTLRSVLIDLMEEHTGTIMIGYTHTQQAQPTTLAHYFSAMADSLRRDMDRLCAAYATVDRSSMGAAALTTSGFKINRERVQKLLGFQEMIDNSWDAVAGADYITETAAAVQLAALHTGRSIQDFLLWGMQEFNAIKLAAPYVQISSIMPQKRNPVSMEHMRALLSSINGDMQTALMMVHNTPFGDIVDTEDDLQPYLWRGIEKLQGIYHLLACVLATMEINRKQLLARAEESFANVTELADTLVRQDQLSFRQAHQVVSASIKELMEAGKERLADFSLDLLNQQMRLLVGKPSSLTEEQFKRSLSPEHFVKVRTLAGGPSPLIMDRHIAVKKKEQHAYITWFKAKKETMRQAKSEIDHILKDWMSEHETK
ncbi:argininosuccinate lyase [Bacillus testis]|uniref:argininosuccinate lyase n=1 Tax=Bacillus testis TaxID=1622072 RepID=UPI00067EA00D|nr:argininosuccinate lyase [Bacillus testis]